MGTLVPFNATRSPIAAAGPFQRPFDAEGVLLAAHAAPQGRAALWLAAGEALSGYIAQACCWRADQRNTLWQAGDYSFLVLEFTVSGGAPLFLQLWSEPEDGKVLFEVCSGAVSAAATRQVARRRQDELRERGFEVGGGAGNFLKHVCIPDRQATASLAREALGILCRVLGYDGTAPLRYHLHLGTRLETRTVHTGVNADDLARLMRSWGCRAERRFDPEAGVQSAALLDCEYGGWGFMVWLARGASDVPGQYGLVCLRRFITEKSLPLAEIGQYVNANLLCMQASIDAEGDLQLEQCVVLDGGVTAQNLRNHLMLWHANLESIRKRIQGGADTG